MEIRCPNCGLLNPKGSIRCDCGYIFEPNQIARLSRLQIRFSNINKPTNRKAIVVSSTLLILIDIISFSGWAIYVYYHPDWIEKPYTMAELPYRMAEFKSYVFQNWLAGIYGYVIPITLILAVWKDSEGWASAALAIVFVMMGLLMLFGGAMVGIIPYIFLAPLQFVVAYHIYKKS